MSGAVLDHAKARFAERERKSIRVPEWGPEGSPLVITYTALTLAERRKIYAPGNDGKPADGASIMARTLIVKACDERGQRLFEELDWHDLMHNVDADVVGRVATAILSSAASGLTAEAVETEKNG